MVSAGSLRVLFLGTPQFAVPTLDHLLRSSHQVVGVITQPDRPRGRGHRVVCGPVKMRALEVQLPVVQPASLKDPAAVAELAALEADIGVVAAFGKILSETVIQTPRLGMVNVHASLLPRYRGAAPIHRAVIAGEHETGVTIMRVVRALDAGPMLATARIPIDRMATSEDVEHALAVIGADLLVATLDRLAHGPVFETPQDDALATYAHRIEKDDGVIDWAKPAGDIHNLVRGLHPWPHAFTFHRGHRLIVHRSDVLTSPVGEAPGTIVLATGDELLVATGAGQLRITEIQSEGSRPMPVRAFLAGHSMGVGDLFTAAP
jgi:methionyl-tRNA formyltransferase